MHETPSQAPLAPAEEEVRVVLRALLGRLLAMEPERYSPLYVGPLRRAEPVRRALAEALARHGGTLVGAEVLWEGGPADAVGLAPLRAAAQVLRDGAGRRWVIVGEEDPDQPRPSCWPGSTRWAWSTTPARSPPLPRARPPSASPSRSMPARTVRGSCASPPSPTPRRWSRRRPRSGCGCSDTPRGPCGSRGRTATRRPPSSRLRSVRRSSARSTSR